IVRPHAGMRVTRASLPPITGVAWAGENSVTRVEGSSDGGKTWSDAQLGEDVKYAWRMWKLRWTPNAGEHEVVVRATDSAGRTQPETSVWNPSGYLWNGWDRVKVTVV